ncbi:MAG: cyclic nucleotide-binding domain-containing protein, partial [Anaerolineales bacterium]|nr:cyclic nucleotide-binding domain-containing protein [Anaerolineales bacterium]
MKRDNQSLIEQFSFLRDAPTAVKEQFQQHVLIRELPAGATVCWEGDQCQQLAIVLEGTVRVYKVGENGRELTLYRLEASESCVLTASCIL